jgi:hypothetical protein
MVKCWIPKIYLTHPSTEPSTPFSSYVGDGRRIGEHMAHGFRLLTSHDRSHYMVLQPHPLAFVCLTLVGFGLWLFYVLSLC